LPGGLVIEAALDSANSVASMFEVFTFLSQTVVLHLPLGGSAVTLTPTFSGASFPYRG